jgi:uncharacterized protein YrrD
MQLTEITGKAVLSVATGARLGRVAAVLLDPSTLAIAALQVAAEGQQAVIPFTQVQSIGPDAVMVPGDEVAQWIATASEAAGLITLDALKHYKVVDDTGTLLGSPRDLYLDAADGRLQSLEVHKGGVLGVGGEHTTVRAGEIASVGVDVVVVHLTPAPPA